MDLPQIIKNNWQTSKSIEPGLLEKHIQQYTLVDSMMAHAPHFFIAMDLETFTYNFLGSSQQNITGFNNEEVERGGLEFLFQQMHPDDGPYVAECGYQKFKEIVTNTPENQRKDLLLQLNYRFKHRDGHWIHLLEHVRILELNEYGVPLITLTHVNHVPDTGYFQGCILVKKITKGNNYETVYSMFYPKTDEVQQLSKREVDIVRLIAKGLKGQEIADELYISLHTVKTHRKNILRKLELKSSGELIAFAMEHHVI